MKNDYHYMKRAISLAQKGTGKTSPNPMVGAVIVHGGKIIGEGFHSGYGSLHAEVEAIQNSTIPVRGGTLYCTLEPCSFSSPEKNNPPCTRRIISEGIKRVVIAGKDPNPKVNGDGIRILREAGIEVITGVMEKESIELNAGYSKWISTGLPYVHLKIAQSLDGRIATKTGKSKWITDETARTEVHRMRSVYDAVLVGSGTVFADNPSLSVRSVEGRDPVRVILDSRCRIGSDYKVVNDGHRTILVTGKKSKTAGIGALFPRNVEIIQVAETEKGLDLKQVLRELGERKIGSLLVEGGGTVFTSFLGLNLWDTLSVFIAPLVIGKGKEAVGDLGTSSLLDSIRFADSSFRPVGNQILFEGKRKKSKDGEGGNVYRIN